MTTTDLPPCRVDEKAFQQAISSLGQVDDECNRWFLEEGNLRSFMAVYESARQQPTVADLDVLKEVRNMVSNGINLRHFPTIQDALREIDTLIQQHEEGRV